MQAITSAMVVNQDQVQQIQIYLKEITMITKNHISGFALGTLLMVGAPAQAQVLSIPSPAPKHLKAVIVRIWPPGPYAWPPGPYSQSPRTGFIHE